MSFSTHSYFFSPDYPSNYGRVPDPHMHTGGFSMDNPEYILNEQRRCGDYHTLGIPIVHSSSPSSHSQGPSSIHSVHSNGMQQQLQQPGGPYPSLSSNGSTVPPPAGLNGVINSRLNLNLGHLGVQRRSSGEESDEHEYYNDLERLKREMQPLQQHQLAPTSPPQSASSAGSAATSVRSTGVQALPTAQPSQPPFKLLPPPASKPETTV